MRKPTCTPLKLAGGKGRELRVVAYGVCVCQRARSAGCDNTRERVTSPWTSNPSNVAVPVSILSAARFQWSPFRRHRRTNDAQLFAHDSSPSRSRIVGVFSTARRKRNHILKLIRRVSTQEIPPRSKTTTPHPPLCSSRSVVFSACSSRFHGFVRLPCCPLSRVG